MSVSHGTHQYSRRDEVVAFDRWAVISKFHFCGDDTHMRESRMPKVMKYLKEPNFCSEKRCSGGH